MDLTAEEWASRAGGRIPDDDEKATKTTHTTTEELTHDQALP